MVSRLWRHVARAATELRFLLDDLVHLLDRVERQLLRLHFYAWNRSRR